MPLMIYLIDITNIDKIYVIKFAKDLSFCANKHRKGRIKYNLLNQHKCRQNIGL